MDRSQTLVELKTAELKHYGVKGMRWGVRRSQAALDRAAGRSKEKKNKKSSSSGDGGSSKTPKKKSSAAKAVEKSKNRLVKEAKRKLEDRRALNEVKRSEKLERAIAKEKAKTDQYKKRLSGEKESSRPNTDPRYSKLTNKSLESAINRMQLEKRYSELKAEERKRNAGVVEKFFEASGEVLASSAKSVAQKQITRLGNEFIERASKRDEGKSRRQIRKETNAREKSVRKHAAKVKANARSEKRKRQLRSIIDRERQRKLFIEPKLNAPSRETNLLVQRNIDAAKNVPLALLLNGDNKKK